MPEIDTTATENGALLDWVEENSERELHTLDPNEIYGVVHDGELKTFTLDRHRLGPDTRKATVLDAASFLDYWAGWADPDLTPEVWTDPKTRTVTGILDARDLTGEGIGWGTHRIVLEPEKTTDWCDWLRHSGKLLTQEQFAEFIEDHLPQIVEPSGADMLEVAQSLQGAVKAEWKQARRLADGQVSLSYVETATAMAGQKGQLSIPAEFTLALAPFKGGAAYKVKARFRYRIAGDQIAVGYKLDRAEDVEDAAWEDVLADIREGLGEQPVQAVLRVGRP